MAAILVPLDGSRFSESVLPLALTVAERMGATLHIVRVHELVAMPVMDAITPMPVIDASLEAESRALQLADLERSAADLRKSGPVPVVCALLEGGVGEALTEYAQAHGITMIVTSTHGRTGVARAALGSVAVQLVRHSGVPVLLLHPGDGHAPASPRAFEHIFVPLDGSTPSETVLTPALALLSGAKRVTLFRMVAPITMDMAPTPMPLAITDPIALEAEMTGARSYLEGIAATLRDQGFTVGVEVSANVAAASSIEEAVKAYQPDLIAMATHARSGLARLIFGSVAESLVAHVQTPVLSYHAASH